MFSFLLLAACSGTSSSGGGTANYTLSLVPVTPPDVNPFDGADRIDLLLDDGVGAPVRVPLDVPESGGSAEAKDLPVLDGARVVVEVYDEGELVGWGQSNPLSSTTDELETTVLVTVPDSLARLGGLPEEWALGGGAALGEGRFVLMGGVGNRSTKNPDRELDVVWTLDLGAPDPSLTFLEADTLPEYVDASGDTETNRRDFTLTRLTSGDAGMFLLVGGSDSIGYRDGTAVTADCRLFDPETSSFSDALPSRDTLHTARTGHQAAANQQGGVLIWGGYGAASAGYFIDLQDGELYDPVARSFSEVEGPREAGEFVAGSLAVGLAAIGSDGVLVAGGARFDGGSVWLVTGTSFGVGVDGSVSPFSDMVPVAAHAMVALDNGDVLAFGGVESDSTHNFDEVIAASPLVQRFDAEAGTWATVGEMEIARAGLSATLIDDRHVVLAGGAAGWGPVEYDDSAISCVEVYDTEDDTTVILNDCMASDAAGGLSAPSQFPLALFDPDLGVLFAGGIDGSNGAHPTTTFFALPRD